MQQQHQEPLGVGGGVGPLQQMTASCISADGTTSLQRRSLMRPSSGKMCTPIEEKLEQNLKVLVCMIFEPVAIYPDALAYCCCWRESRIGNGIYQFTGF